MTELWFGQGEPKVVKQQISWVEDFFHAAGTKAGTLGRVTQNHARIDKEAPYGGGGLGLNTRANKTKLHILYL